ncbi:MAG: hypothetical protein ACREMW_14455 [Gemmatimonadales bacterium]
MRNELPRVAWKQFSQVTCRAHPLRRLLHLAPLTRRAFEKPRGYPGDAETLDLVYGATPPPSGLSAFATALYRWELETPACRSVRARRDTCAALIDSAAARRPHARVLSVACGHMREVDQSLAWRTGQAGELVGLDQDGRSLATVATTHAGCPIKTIRGSIARIPNGCLDTFREPHGNIAFLLIARAPGQWTRGCWIERSRVAGLGPHHVTRTHPDVITQ